MVVGVGEADAAVTAASSIQDRETLRSHQTPPANRRRRDIQSTPGSTPSKRVSPYPLRKRTPRQLLSPSAAPAHQQARVSLDASPANAVHHVADQHRLQLVVQPLVKDTVGSRDSSARMLDVFAANGATFGDIMHKIWEQFSSRVKGLAVKEDDTRSINEPTEAAWYESMQFKWNGHLIPPTKTEIAWNRWLTQRRDDTVTLLIYEYGLGIPSARALEELKDARIRPQHTDRSGAAAEASIREIVAKLQAVWGETYQGSAMAWRM
ncbi:hypothetical protein DVH05_023025 [Phytophthora capsici]|nr:hypothetical protein DVH05_023025 [Phytophthora capsici]